MNETIPVREGLFRETSSGATLLGTKCNSCGHIDFPATNNCLACRSPDLASVELGSEGTLLCETTVHMKTANYAPGYSVGYVSLPNGLRVFSQLRKDGGKPFKVGMPMKLEIATLWQSDGKDVQAYRFFPA